MNRPVKKGERSDEKREGRRQQNKIRSGCCFCRHCAQHYDLAFCAGSEKQLWEQSVSTIIESTMQGCNTLRIQLEDEYQSMGTVAGYMKEFSSQQKEELQLALESYAKTDQGAALYLSDGRVLPAGTGKDEEAQKQLWKTNKKDGIINPHISSVTGVNVFDLFIRFDLRDGETGFLVKEYEVENIVDSFSLSFYNDAGFPM